ncbi:hypothetical protein [Streptomyces sp. SM11]|uniref:hypothetical protein n=1 Tax=Streptomyces sp. SM11 TaxID=565557 RepID=UPI000CD58B62|nr:hypothetical protein [Streptomyces sp. SM11]
MITATRLEAAAAAVTVMSNRAEVTDWSARYFGQWWNSSPVEAATVYAGAVLVADVDPEAYAALTLLVHDGRHTAEVEYARHRMLVARDGEDIIATSPDEAIAYRSSPASGRLTLTGIGVMELSLAAARLAREVFRGQLLRDGWAVLHSSAVVRPEDGAALLAFGGKGAGKTTTALLLASSGWQLLANDRVLVRPTGTRGVEVVPWPSAAAVGLGLLASLGWGAAARGHVKKGGAFHPTQHDAVTTALLAGDFTPLWEDEKRREKKVQVFPDQFTSLFGVELATGGRAAGLLFPRVDAESSPDVVGGAVQALGDDDFMSGRTEDRYPDIFELAGGVDGGGRRSARDEVSARLAVLPHQTVRLSHDVPASVAALRKAAEAI